MVAAESATQFGVKSRSKTRVDNLVGTKHRPRVQKPSYTECLDVRHGLTSALAATPYLQASIRAPPYRQDPLEDPHRRTRQRPQYICAAMPLAQPSIQTETLLSAGLLRCARNDDLHPRFRGNERCSIDLSFPAKAGNPVSTGLHLSDRARHRCHMSTGSSAYADDDMTIEPAYQQRRGCPRQARA